MWTDAIQLMLMVLAVLLVILLGIFNLKNLMDIWNAADRGGRLIFFELDDKLTLLQNTVQYNILFAHLSV